MKQSKTIRRRRRLLSPPKTSAPFADLTDTNERLKRKASKYNNNDESRRQGRKD